MGAVIIRPQGEEIPLISSSLAGAFGMQPLIGKSLAILIDARISGENIATVVERLLCISGEDTFTIDRKHLTSVTMKLPMRFVFLTNELPQLSDALGALAGRFTTLKLTESFVWPRGQDSHRQAAGRDSRDSQLGDRGLETPPPAGTF